MTTGDPTTDGFLVVVFGLLLILALVAAAGVLRLLEKASPRLSKWLDRHVGEEPEWRPDRHEW